MRTIVPRSDHIRILDSHRNDRDLVKVITGLHGCGKSELIRQFIDHLMNDGIPGSEIIHIDLRRERYGIDSGSKLYDTLKDRIRNEGTYILLDGVQYVDGWERTVSTLMEEHSVNVYVTTCSYPVQDIHHIMIPILPFSFREFLIRYPVDPDNGYPQRFGQYLRWGGMPIVDLEDDDTKNRSILEGILHITVNNYILSGSRMDPSILMGLTTSVMSGTGHPTSISELTDGSYIGDVRTTWGHLRALEDAHIIHISEDHTGHRGMRIYPADTGLMNTLLYGRGRNLPGQLECVVFLELVRRGYRVSTSTSRRNGVDIVAQRDDGGPEFYQIVPWSDDPRALKRKMTSFRKMGTGRRMVLLTMDREEYEVPDGVELINVVDWLLTVP